MNTQTDPHLDLTAQEPIPTAGVEAALALMQSGKLHRYGEVGAKPSEASMLEVEFAKEVGAKYCVAMNSCGSTMFVALKAAGVKPGDKVLSNCFTLAPVPGAIAHVGALPVLVDITDDLVIDMDDLERKAKQSGAKVLLLSHMRGHICDMQVLAEFCTRHDITLIEDCAHTMGAAWDGHWTGRWGKAGCFSLQSYKHANSGEGGLLVTDDEDIAAQAVLLSGSYMLYRAHVSRPDDSVFERWEYITPNFSLRMSNLAAALARPQFGLVLADRGNRWNQRYSWIAEGLSGAPGLRLPHRPAKEQYIASSIQFVLEGMSSAQISAVIDRCAKEGVHIKWFGADAPIGFTSVWRHWQFFGEPQVLPNADRILQGLCDVRIPLTLTQEQCRYIADVIKRSLETEPKHLSV
ncbi:MAG TPA: aminotransferase class I/II-fold pyridoxal phosphate-dependent enzyme [Orrella sp.]